MITDKDTQIQVLTRACQKLAEMQNINPNDFIKSEFKEALVAKYNALKYPQMNVIITQQ